MAAMRASALAALAAFAVVCAACGGGTADTSSDDGSSEAAAGSARTTAPEPDAAAEQPDDHGDSGGGDVGGDVSVQVPDPESAGDDPEVTATTAPESDVATTTPSTTTTTVPEPVAIALNAIELPPITELGATGQASISATYSDGRIEHVLPADAQWHTSDSTVVTVTDGIVTATGPGAATITAHYEQHQIAIAATVRISVADTATMRLLYAVPSDREFRDDYSEFFQQVVADVQGWYRNQLNGLTFSVYDYNPQRCQMTEDSEYYSRESWNRVLEGVQHCAPVEGLTTEHIWLLFVDVDPACAPDGTVGNYEDGYNQLYRGGHGLAILNYSTQIDGYDNMIRCEDWIWYYCDEGPWDGSLLGTTGGVAHEVGHTLGLQHLPGCDEGRPECDFDALMAYGFGIHPHGYLRPDEKAPVMRSPFIDTTTAPATDQYHSPDDITIEGTIHTTNNDPTDTIQVSLEAGTFWGWAPVTPAGTFEIHLPADSSGHALLSVHTNNAGPCRWLGYAHTDGTLTALAEQAATIDIAGSNLSGLEVALPATVNSLCTDTRTISGTIVDPDGPVTDIWLGNYVSDWHYSADGSFELDLPAFGAPPATVFIESPDCGFLGLYGPNGFSTDWETAVGFWTAGVDIAGIVVTLPAPVAELCE